MPRIRCFAPIADTDARILILGSMPGKASLAANQYYAHPRNIFWIIMGELIGAHRELRYEDRLKILRSSGIALWDVLGYCLRKSSLDAHIEMDSAVPGDFKSFFRQHPDTTQIFFNGAKAEQCFEKYVLPTLKSTSLQYQRLPSTSPANAGISYEQKLLAWKSVVRSIKERSIN
jgi:TDG/mug DNA glycosylase family protein